MAHTEGLNAKQRLDRLTGEFNIFDVKFYLNHMAPISNEDAAAQAANWIEASFKGTLQKYQFPDYDLPA